MQDDSVTWSVHGAGLNERNLPKFTLAIEVVYESECRLDYLAKWEGYGSAGGVDYSTLGLLGTFARQLLGILGGECARAELLGCEEDRIAIRFERKNDRITFSSLALGTNGIEDISFQCDVNDVVVSRDDVERIATTLLEIVRRYAA